MFRSKIIITTTIFLILLIFTSVIKNQFGKAIYGEVVDKILKETSTKAIEEKKN